MLYNLQLNQTRETMKTSFVGQDEDATVPRCVLTLSFQRNGSLGFHSVAYSEEQRGLLSFFFSDKKCSIRIRHMKKWKDTRILHPY